MLTRSLSMVDAYPCLGLAWACHPKYKMAKRVILVVASLFIVCLVLLIYRRASMNLVSAPGEGEVMEAFDDPDFGRGDVGKIGIGPDGLAIENAEGFNFVKPGKYKIEFTRRLSSDEGNLVFSEPRVELYGKNQQVVEITADAITIPSDEFADLQNQLPNTGSLEGDVQIKLSRRDIDDAELFVKMEGVDFRREFSRIVSSGAVDIKAVDFEALGSDLTLQYDQVNDQLQELELRNLKKLRLSAELLNTPSKKKSVLTKPDDEQPTTPDRQAKSKFTTYRLTLSDNVVIDQKEQRMLAETIEVLACIDASQTARDRSVVKEEVDNEDTTVISKQDITDDTEYVELTCDGPMRIATVQDSSATKGKLEFSARGKPVEIWRKGELAITADVVVYNNVDRKVKLQSSDNRDVWLSIGPEQFATAQEISFDGQDRIAVLAGPGRIEYGSGKKDPNDTPDVITYKGQVKIKLAEPDTKPASMMTVGEPEWMEFTGGISGEIANSTFHADRGRLVFFDKVQQHEGIQDQDPNQQLAAVKSIALAGNVRWSDKNNQITGDRIIGETDKGDITKEGVWLIEGTPAKAQLAQHRQLTGEKIRLDLRSGYCVIDGEGAMDDVISRDLTGGALARPVPMRIVWHNGAQYNVNSSEVILRDAEVHFEQRDDKTRRHNTVFCTKLNITMTLKDDPNRVQDDSTADDDDVRYEPDQLTATGPVVRLVSKQYDLAKGNLISEMEMQSQQMRFDNKTQLLTANGQGWIELVDYRQNKAQARPDRDDEPESLANVLSGTLGGDSKGGRSPSYMFLHFLDKMEYNQADGKVLFTSGVALHRAPLNDDSSFPTVDNYWREGALKLQCDELEFVGNSNKPSQNVSSYEMDISNFGYLRAAGDVVLELARKEKANHFIANESLVFDNNSQEITIRGSKNQPVRFNQVQFLWLKYNLATGVIKGVSSDQQSIITR